VTNMRSLIDLEWWNAVFSMAGNKPNIRIRVKQPRTVYRKRLSECSWPIYWSEDRSVRLLAWPKIWYAFIIFLSCPFNAPFHCESRYNL
jgi:hypothetical protein